MATQTGKYMIGIAIIIAVAIIAAALILNPNIIQQQQKKTITIDGTFTQSVAPDNVQVTFSATTNGSNASSAQSANTAITDRIIAAFKAAGYTDNDLSTQYYNVNPIYNYSSGTNQIVGYQAVQQIAVNDTNISAAGKLVDIAVDNGATSIDYVNFGLKPATENTIRVQALSQASQNAKDKADAIAQGLGTSVKGIVSVSEGNVLYPPYVFNYASAAEASGSAPNVKTVQITPGNVDVTATVSVTFELA